MRINETPKQKSRSKTIDNRYKSIEVKEKKQSTVVIGTLNIKICEAKVENLTDEFYNVEMIYKNQQITTKKVQIDLDEKL